jgi:hypothetical protein
MTHPAAIDDERRDIASVRHRPRDGFDRASRPARLEGSPYEWRPFVAQAFRECEQITLNAETAKPAERKYQ